MGFRGISWDFVGFRGAFFCLVFFVAGGVFALDLVNFFRGDFVGFRGISWDFVGFRGGHAGFFLAELG